MGRKARPAASSAKALEVCGDTSRLGVSAADVFAQFNAPISSYSEERQCVALDDVEVSLALQALQKKDPTTRLRNVQELHQLFSLRSSDKLNDVCAPFLHIYRRLWPQDSEPRVREGLQRCLQVLVESLQRDFAKHLRSAFPTWLCAMFDTHTEVAQAARLAFRSTFNEEKRRGVFRHSLRECLELLRSNLKHSEQSLHDELGIVQSSADKDNALERQDRYARVVASSLSALGELVQVCSAPLDAPGGGAGAAKATLTGEQLQPFLEVGSPCGVWPRLSSKQPTAIRRAAVQCLVRILRCEADMGLACATSTNRAAALNAMADEQIVPSSAAALVLAFAAAGEQNNCWEGLDAGKSLWPQLQSVLRRAKNGAATDAVDFLMQFQQLVEVLPKNAWMPGKAEQLLREILEALAPSKVRSAFATAAGASWKAYFAICRACGIPVENPWRWHPLALYLNQPMEISATSPPEVSLPRPVLGALCGAIGEDLPLMSEEVRKALLQRISDNVPTLEAAELADAAVSTSSSKSAWRAWVQMLQQLLMSEDLKESALQLLTQQIGRLFLVLLRSQNTTEFLEALEALSVLLLCEAPKALPEDKDLEDAMATITNGGSEGRKEVSNWPEEAHLLAWPILPWWCSLMNSKVEAELVGRKLIQPFLEVLPRRIGANQLATFRDTVRDQMFQAVLSKKNFSEGSGSGILAFCLCLEALMEYQPFESEMVEQALQDLVDLVAKGDKGSLDEALQALQVALLHRPMDDPRMVEWMEVLVSTATSANTEKSLQLRLILLVSKAVTNENVTESKEIHLLMEPLCRALLKTLMSSEDADAWSMLSRLLKRLDQDQASQLLAESSGDRSGGNWLRILLEGSTITSLSPLSLLCKARQGQSEDGTSPLPRGAISSQHLRDSALAAARLLQQEKLADLVLLERQEPVLLEVFWEVLLAVTCGATDDDVALQGARKIWRFLKEMAPKDTKQRFLNLCIRETSSEGSTWWFDPGDRELLQNLPVCASLTSLAVLRHVLEVVWYDSMAAKELGMDNFLTSLESGEHPRAGWGFASAALLHRGVEIGAIDQERAFGMRSEMRLRLQDLCDKKKISEPLLTLAGSMEQICQDLSMEKVKLSDLPIISENATTPLITESVDAEMDQVKDEVEAEDLDTGLIDLMEKMLRWSQSGGSNHCRNDALAAFAASCWPSVEGSTSQGGKMSQRMTRLALETLGIKSGLAAVDTAETLPVTPGVWRLISVLCGRGQWPSNRWPVLLQSLIKGNSWLSAHLGLVSVAFLDDAFEALSSVLSWAPVASSVESLAILLGASDNRLRTAAAQRLQAHVWVPARMALSSQPWSSNGMSATDALSNFEQLLEAHNTGLSEQRDETNPPSVGDVSYTVLDAVLGEEMTKTIWSVSDALEHLAAWETSAESDDEVAGEVEDVAPSRGQRMREGYGPSPELFETTAITPSSSSRRMPWMEDRGVDELPLDTAKCCVASIAAWETLLKGIDRGVLEGASSAGGSEKAEQESASPAVLLAALLQLNPDQVAHENAKVFPTQAAPQSQWSSPLQPLLRLLCHLLTSSRLVGFSLDESDTSEALLSSALSQETASYDLLPLAARTLLLALRVAPCAVRSFWENLPRRRDRSLVEKLISRSFTPFLIQAEVAAASALLEAEGSKLPDIQTQVVRRPRQLLLQLSREDLRAELFIQLPASFPLRPAQAEVPEKMPGIPKPRVRNWILQARQVLSGQRPMAVGQALLMWARSFALFFKGVEDCPICYNVIHLTTQTIPRKACPTCKHKFHNECLYQWFRTSSKTTCPLCNQPF